MSKPLSGLFEGTAGELVITRSLEKIVRDRTRHLDTQEHARTSLQLSKAKQRGIVRKIKGRSATKQEYKEYMSNLRFEKRRRAGIKRFWAQERRRLIAGRPGTRNWTPEQRKSILQRKVPKYNGKPIEAHHSFSASKYPQLANRGEVIVPLTHHEHFQGWHGGNYRQSLPGKPIRHLYEF